jgi:hypothetical protein
MIRTVLVGFVKFIGLFVLLVVKSIVRVILFEQIVIAFKPKVIVFQRITIVFELRFIVFKPRDFIFKPRDFIFKREVIVFKRKAIELNGLSFDFSLIFVVYKEMMSKIMHSI